MGRIIVAGAGHVGLLAAFALKRSGHDVLAIGALPGAADKRTTALMMPAIRFLQSVGLWETIEPHAAPMTSMRIIDGTSRLIRSSTVTFDAAEIGEPTFGYNIPNQALSECLGTALAASGVDVVASQASRYALTADGVEIETADGSVHAGEVVIAADGRSSLAREAAGIAVRQWSYRQTAVVLSFRHSRDHHDTSTEFHTEHGPFTQVPLSGRRSSLVWVTTPENAERLMTLEPKDLATSVEERMQSMLGAVTIETGPQSWPLAGLVPSAFARNRVYLAGEAAHVFPPIGAQGLNLGIRDVEALLETLPLDGSDLGADGLIAAYNRARRPDILARTGAVDALNRSLLSDFLPMQIVRSGGLELLRAFSPLRSFIMREGLRPGSGWRAAASRRTKPIS
ncbi:UbiH/UbiF family hydroxylase [Phyllobacterium sp. 0TCS1.6C]|uniref:UbiH/UbiF family hydroxylase n=1 Tax=unclassified Phyllobacterium TaxID=2638441 RepID=UPI002263D88C|nr:MULTISPECIES: UbiH/UbiF family hydroxylase [unclassified Phyllobacterium]MCX8282238.1 UbiH/UbiF family hydroxylase [Phyllobacterium sp. 0TCS1.6C]MCX8294926.1 UbiH/UbiF family hydroxylase [Phyllobacterium sp. 0TCS1.6A]